MEPLSKVANISNLSAAILIINFTENNILRIIEWE